MQTTYAQQVDELRKLLSTIPEGSKQWKVINDAISTIWSRSIDDLMQNSRTNQNNIWNEVIHITVVEHDNPYPKLFAQFAIFRR